MTTQEFPFKQHWISQYSPSVPGFGPTACYRTCLEMAKRGWGCMFPASTESRIQLANAEFEEGEIAPSTDGFALAKKYMMPRLADGMPVIVGLHYKMGSGNRDRITDHFNLLCGVENLDGETIIVGLNPGAEVPHGEGHDYNAAFKEFTDECLWRVVYPHGLKASMSMVIPHVGWEPR